MKDFFSKEEYTEQDINNLISNKAEEAINLEFKSSDSLGTQEQKKKELAKDVSSFANSEGGIIVYGIRETTILQNHYMQLEHLMRLAKARVRKFVNE